MLNQILSISLLLASAPGELKVTDCEEFASEAVKKSCREAIEAAKPKNETPTPFDDGEYVPPREPPPPPPPPGYAPGLSRSSDFSLRLERRQTFELLQEEERRIQRSAAALTVVTALTFAAATGLVAGAKYKLSKCHDIDSCNMTKIRSMTIGGSLLYLGFGGFLTGTVVQYVRAAVRRHKIQRMSEEGYR